MPKRHIFLPSDEKLLPIYHTTFILKNKPSQVLFSFIQKNGSGDGVEMHGREHPRYWYKAD